VEHFGRNPSLAVVEDMTKSYQFGSSPAIPGFRPNRTVEVVLNERVVNNWLYANVEKGIVLHKHDLKSAIVSRSTGFVYVKIGFRE